jgi:hypothetical protein
LPPRWFPCVAVVQKEKREGAQMSPSPQGRLVCWGWPHVATSDPPAHARRCRASCLSHSTRATTVGNPAVVPAPERASWHGAASQAATDDEQVAFAQHHLREEDSTTFHAKTTPSIPHSHRITCQPVEDMTLGGWTHLDALAVAELLLQLPLHMSAERICPALLCGELLSRRA